MSVSATFLPLPLISGCTCSSAGGSVLGMVISGTAVLVGDRRQPGLGLHFLVPSGPSSGTATMSTTNISVSPTLTPICGLPPAAS